MNKVDELLNDYVKKEKAKQVAYDLLRDAAIDAFEFKVGDVIRQRNKIGKVTRIGFEVKAWGDKPKIDITPYAYPLKKDGTVSKVGEMRPWPWAGANFELVERPKQ